METIARNGRSEEQVLGALAGHPQSGLAVTLGGETRYLAPLRIKAERVWKERVAAKVTAVAGAVNGLADITDAQGLTAVLGSNVEDALTLVAEFDALGGGTLSREWLEDNVTGIEIRDALEVLLDSAYPPMPGGMAKPGRILLGLLLAGEAARAVSPTSTNASAPATTGQAGRQGSKRR